MSISKLILIAVVIIVIFKLYSYYQDNFSMDHVEFGTAEIAFKKNGLADVNINVDVADTVAERAKGLMFVKSMPEDKGMLFDYKSSGVRRMWMKNTYISLDMIFVDEKFKIKHIIENTIPESLNQLSSIVPVSYVIEVNAGFVAKNNISINDHIEILGK